MRYNIRHRQVDSIMKLSAILDKFVVTCGESLVSVLPHDNGDFCLHWDDEMHYAVTSDQEVVMGEMFGAFAVDDIFGRKRWLTAHTPANLTDYNASPNRSIMNNLTPVHDHDCKRCTLLGSVRSLYHPGTMADLYVCDDDDATYLARYSSDGPDYSSAKESYIEVYPQADLHLARTIYKIAKVAPDDGHKED